jgi:hypothetical protein
MATVVTGGIVNAGDPIAMRAPAGPHTPMGLV